MTDAVWFTRHPPQPKDEGTPVMAEEHHDNHGQTPAAWTAVTIIMIAFFVGTLGIVLGQWWLFWVGVGLVVVGAVVGKVMQMMGLGKQVPNVATTYEPASVDATAGSAATKPGETA